MQRSVCHSVVARYSQWDYHEVLGPCATQKSRFRLTDKIQIQCGRSQILVHTNATSTSKAAMKCIAAVFTVACVTANEYLPETAGARKCAKLWERCNGIVPPIGPCEVGASCTDGMYVAECRILSLTAQNGLPAMPTAAKPQKLCRLCSCLASATAADQTSQRAGPQDSMSSAMAKVTVNGPAGKEWTVCSNHLTSASKLINAQLHLLAHPVVLARALCTVRILVKPARSAPLKNYRQQPAINIAALCLKESTGKRCCLACLAASHNLLLRCYLCRCLWSSKCGSDQESTCAEAGAILSPFSGAERAQNVYAYKTQSNTQELQEGTTCFTTNKDETLAMLIRLHASRATAHLAVAAA
eukprot:1262-Heterococcus_DN1.PRE.2